MVSALDTRMRSALGGLILRTALAALIPLASLFASLVPGTARAEDWFGAPVVTPTDQAIRTVMVRDMNGDGIADLIGCSISPSATVVWLGDPSGVMSFAQGIPGSVYGPFIIVDENADGFPDLIAGDPFDVWDNDGTGHFTDTGRAIRGSFGDTADLNNDGLSDVVMKTNADSVTIYLGAPGGLPTSGEMIPIIFDGEPSGTYYIQDLGLGDIDGDHNADLLLAGTKFTDPNYWAEFRWRLGRGDGTFGPIGSYRAAEWYELTNMEMADLDLDGAMDVGVMLVGFEWGHTAFYRYNRATATMQFLNRAPSTGLPHMARMDVDPRPDLLLCDYPNLVRICRGTAPGTFEVVQVVAGGDGGVGRVTGGYGPDLVVATDTTPSEIHVHLNIVITADAGDREGAGGGEDAGARAALAAGLRVWPSIGASSASPVRVQWNRSLADPSAQIEVVAVDGRRVRILRGQAGEARWDLDSDDGSPVGSGVYWIRLMDGHENDGHENDGHRNDGREIEVRGSGGRGAVIAARRVTVVR